MDDESPCERTSRNAVPALVSMDREEVFIMTTRTELAYQTRETAARRQRDAAHPTQAVNEDETRYATRIANFHKGLPHDANGHVIPAAYESLRGALSSGLGADFENIQLGLGRKLVNPQAGLALDLEGPDGQQPTMPPPPRLASAEQAAEMVENYWMALARDVHFARYASDPLILRAATDLDKVTEYHGPTEARLLFRGDHVHDHAGPYLSQFMYLDTPFGAESVNRMMRTVVPGLDYGFKREDWLALQNGRDVTDKGTFDATRRYIRNGRDLGEWVHIDALYQAYFNACLILLDAEAPFDENNPYQGSQTQLGFGTFGGPHILSLVTEVATRALKAVWHQKWYVHRRLRPEAMAGLVDNQLAGRVDYQDALHGDLLASDAVKAVRERNQAHGADTVLLPLAFPEGSPTHPSYGAGHATVAGACVTILKAWFNESTRLVDIPRLKVRKTETYTGAVQATADGMELEPYTGADRKDLTVGGELDKLAANVAIGRDFAGVHWRTDYRHSLRLGEAIAIGVLRDQRDTYNEKLRGNFQGFSLTTFDDQEIVV